MATLATERDHQPVFGLRPLHWMLVGIIALALGGGGYALSGGALVAYASVAGAKAQERNVQVFSYLYSKGAYDD